MQMGRWEIRFHRQTGKDICKGKVITDLHRGLTGCGEHLHWGLQGYRTVQSVGWVLTGN
jgi:hypothetical protein